VAIAPAWAQAPAITSLSVEQVAELVPGTELVFRANATANGVLRLKVDGVASLIELPQARPGAYEGAYTVSIRDKITPDSKVTATLAVGDRQATAVMAQHLLTAEAHAKATAAANPALAISRFETGNSGALAGGHEVNFTVNGTPGAKASVSLDGGKTRIALAEEKAGVYTGSYTIKTRDRLNDSTQVRATLEQGARKASLVKPLLAGATVASPVAVAAPKCDTCGVVQSVTAVKLKGKPNFVGAIAGGVAGGVLGNQVGKGDGNTAATVIGAVGGAVAGREIEKRVRASTVYDVVVKMEDASTRTVRFEAQPAFTAGSKVKLSGTTLVAND
jgi:outer membrane lipoprotein SlyB